MKNEEIKFGAKKILKKLSETYNDLKAFVFYTMNLNNMNWL